MAAPPKNTPYFKIILLLIIGTVLLTTPALAAEEMVTNGDFSQDGYGWTESISSGNSGSASISYSISDLTTQDLAVYFTAVTGRDYVYASLSQNVDLTYVDTLTFKLIDIDIESYSNWGGFQVKVGNTVIWERDVNDISTAWTTYSADVSGYTGTQTVTFLLYLDSNGNSHEFTVGLTDVSAISAASAPVWQTGSLSTNTVSTSTDVTASLTVTAGYPDTTFYVEWGDGYTSSTTSASQGTITETLTHQYTSVGTYTVKASAFTQGVGSTNLMTLGTVTVVSLDFSAYPTSGDPPLVVQFSADGANIESVLWDFGDGATSTQTNPIHTYAASDTPYTVTLTGYTSQGYAVVIPKADYILASAQSITWNQASYEAGDSATLTWKLRNPDFNTYTYTLQIIPSDSQGNLAGSSVITPVTVTSAEDSYTWNTDGYSGYYTAAIYRSGSNVPIVISTISVTKLATLTVNLAVSGTTHTENTTVQLSKDGTVIQTETTDTGQVQFTVPTGTYALSATTTGYVTQSATVQLTENAAITIDFVTGSSETSNIGGSGTSYASTFITFRCLDEITAKPLTGVTVSAVGINPTSPVDWIANLFGAQWGQQILDTQVSGTTDSYGAITFPMFLSIQYTITATYNGETKTLIMTPSSLQSEYIIQIPSYEEPEATAAEAVQTTILAGNEGLLDIRYTDASQTTQSATVQIYQKYTYDDEYTLIQTMPSLGNTYNNTYQLEEYRGTDIKIIITAQTGAFGEVVRTYYHTYAGMMIDLGLPDDVYTWICILTALLIAGIATFLQAPTVCFVIVFVEWVYYFLGWANGFGPAFLFALILATLLSVAFYMARR